MLAGREVANDRDAERFHNKYIEKNPPQRSHYTKYTCCYDGLKSF